MYIIKSHNFQLTYPQLRSETDQYSSLCTRDTYICLLGIPIQYHEY